MSGQAESISCLKLLRNRYSQVKLAKRLEVSSKTLRRWEKGEIIPPSYILPALQQMLGEADQDQRYDFTFVDLFAGIGGTRLGFEANGGKCVFTSEWNTYARKTYIENFGEGHPIAGDITQVEAQAIPDHDILLAGFPCQPFSLAGVSKKNSLGRAHGFQCVTQGTLFFDIERIIEAKRPAAFLLENVKNLLSHDKGRTFMLYVTPL